MVPDRQLVSASGLAAALAFATLFWPALAWPAWVMLLAVLALVVMDWRQTRAIRMPGFSLQLPSSGRVGAPATLTLSLHNHAEIAQRVEVLLELPEDLGGDLAIEQLELAPGERREILRKRTPRRRGLRPLGPSLLVSRSRLGLFWRRSSHSEPTRFAVLPDPGVPDSGALNVSRLEARLGIRPQRSRGEGFEFESLREYVPGDDPRHIDWRASARSEKLIARQYQVERNHTVIVCVDTGRLMSARVGGTTKLDHAVAAGVALARATRAAGDRVGWVAFDREIRAWVAPIDARKTVGPLLEATLPLEPSDHDPRYRVLADLLSQRQKKRSLLVILTDFVEGASSATLESYLGLLVRRHCVLLVALRDPLLSQLEEPAPRIDGAGIYQRLVLQDLLVEREIALARLRRMGAQTLDLHPKQVTVPLLARYLEIRRAGLL